jgi:hypothetical protein
MAKQIYDLVATTELEAVNAMLASIGEAPLDTLDGATQSDVQTAINILRDTTREVQSEGWRFNTEFGFEIAPELAFDYADSSGVTTRLGVYRPPVNLVKFAMTQSPDQQGSGIPTLYCVRRAPSSWDPQSATSRARPTFLVRASAQSSRAPSRRVSRFHSLSRSTLKWSRSLSPATTHVRDEQHGGVRQRQRAARQRELRLQWRPWR